MSIYIYKKISPLLKVDFLLTEDRFYKIPKLFKETTEKIKYNTNCI